MAAIRHMVLWRQLRVPARAVLVVAICLTLIRARDQPGIDVSVGKATATIVPGDVAIAALLVVAVAALVRRGVPKTMRLTGVAAAAFVALVLATAAANGSSSFVSAAKMTELAVLALGAATVVESEDVLEGVVDVLLVFTFVADGIGLVKFVTSGGGRQSAFLGEHDFAALATLPLLYGLVLIFEERRTTRAWLAVAAGGIGCILGAALASLLGFYLGVLALVALVALRGRLTLRPLVVTAAVVAVVSAGTLGIRAGELGFLQAWFGKPESRPGQYAASWSQRLIYTYIGGRIFLGHPVLGVGWYPDLPPSEFARYVPAARRRFADQPRRYFPPTDRPMSPQQSFDEIAAELGVVGSAAFVGMIGSAARVAARRTLPLAWLGAAVGAILGEALYGGTPLTAIFWLVLGLSLAAGASRA